MSEMDLAALLAETSAQHAPYLGNFLHPLVPPELAPPGVAAFAAEFLEEFPFDRNVFGMTRFPQAESAGLPDPVSSAIAEARKACADHGLTFHLASDHRIADDLWQNVLAHMWCSRYGIGFFEDRVDRQMNYNLCIEVGAMLMTGRRTAVLKDTTIDALPIDIVGHLWDDVDLGTPNSCALAVHRWIRDDLRLGSCTNCGPTAAD